MFERDGDPKFRDGLTDEEINEIRFSQNIDDTRIVHLLRKVEAKLKENT